MVWLMARPYPSIHAFQEPVRAWPDALAHPASVAALLGLLASSWRGHRRGELTWKGRLLAGRRGPVG